jgi:hypothetical protein
LKLCELWPGAADPTAALLNPRFKGIFRRLDVKLAASFESIFAVESLMNQTDPRPADFFSDRPSSFTRRLRATPVL